jgi:hypothetical protein
MAAGVFICLAAVTIAVLDGIDKDPYCLRAFGRDLYRRDDAMLDMVAAFMVSVDVDCRDCGSCGLDSR